MGNELIKKIIVHCSFVARVLLINQPKKTKPMTNNNMLKGTIVLLICIFGTYVFFYPPNDATGLNNNNTGNDTIKLNAVGAESICMDYTQYKPSTLSTGLVREMVTTYRDNQLKSIENDAVHPVKSDAYSIWFDLDTIKKFIYHIEKGVQKNGQPGSKLGLRMYYAAYPDKAKWNSQGYEDLAGFIGNTLTEQYEKKHTLVMIPTIQLASGNDADFNPFDKTTYNNGIIKDDGKPNVDDFSQVQVMAITATNNPNDPNSGNTIARNHGYLCPPGNTINLGF